MGRMKTIKGTKPTLMQRRILEKHKKDPEKFMFVKEIIKHENGEYNSRNRSSLNKTSPKVRYLQFVEKSTMGTIELEV